MTDEKKEQIKDPFTKKCIEEGEPLAKKLRQLRKESGLTQEELAKELDLSLPCIRTCERDDVKIPFYVVRVYCEYFCLPPETFLPCKLGYTMSETEEWIEDNLNYLSQEQMEVIRKLMEQFLDLTPPDEF